MLQKVASWLHFKPATSTPMTRPDPVIVPRAQHSISRESIHPNALKVLYRLHHSNFAAHLVGGSVRDLLVGLRPKDFDVATDAHPEQVQQLFRNCRLIGRRFRLAHIYFHDGIVEVATFRANVGELSEAHHRSAEGMILRDNIYGSLAEDAWRRDFTINALYYNIADFSVIDYTGGMKDIEHRIIRMIGDPVQRYQEDPVRMLRGVRLAAKLYFTIEPHTEKPIFEMGSLLQNVPAARLAEEMIKIFKSGRVHETFKLLHHYGLFNVLFPQVAASLTEENGQVYAHFINLAFTNADERLAEQKPLNSAFLFAILLWPPLQLRLQQNLATGLALYPALHLAMQNVVRQQTKLISFPRQLITSMQDIWLLQYRFPQRTNKWAFRILHHPRFRAAYDFLLLRGQAGEDVQDLITWWSLFQTSDETERHALIASLQNQNRGTVHK
ncbi:MAG: polynucleotide adenylyltransferase PcnB, partial [Gammaproteobacteria bacterium]